jgi:two-component system chemotaxis response regulator CheY
MGALVLIVDDSLMVRKQVARALTEAGYSTIEAIDGADALEKLKATPDLKLVVSDVNMPRMNGIELLESMKKENLAVPVIMLTTEGQQDLVQRAKALGAKGWIVKPFKPELLLAAAKRLTQPG